MTACWELYHEPKNDKLLMTLADAYFARSDYYLTITIAWKVIDESGDNRLKADAHKLIGLCNLFVGNDLAAYEAFKEALKLSSGDVESRINLAGMLKHYQHLSAANKIYKSLPMKLKLKETGTLIHPVAKEMYYEFERSQKQ